jgi:hypothetical protein
MIEGLGIGCSLDEHILFKNAQMNLNLGVDNVGKTFWKVWYYTVLARKHGLKFLIYCSENEVWSIKAKIIGFLIGTHIKEISDKEYKYGLKFIHDHFKFIDTNKPYQIRDLLKIFEDNPHDCYMIDPYNSVRKPKGVNTHDYEYEIADEIRRFCRKSGSTVEINMHPSTEGNRMKHKDGPFKDLQAPPMKSQAEGGTKWPSRCDDFTIIHRYFKDGLKNYTVLFVDKIKETETGGDRTLADNPLMFEFSNYGFSIGGVNPMKDSYDKNIEEESIESNPSLGLKNIGPDDDLPF